MIATIAALWLYPVKGMAGIALSHAKILATGFEGDREWVAVDEHGRALTQRECPQLALITPRLNVDASISLTAAGSGPCLLQSTAEPLDITIFGKPARANLATPEVSAWLSARLGQSTRLVRFNPQFPRQCKPARFGDASMMFADGAPYLVANTASLAALDRNRDKRRFRANIWLSGLTAFAEHTCTRLTVDAVSWSLVDHCQRCSVVLVDPDSGERTESGRWLLQLAALNAMPDQPRAAAFGVNSTLLTGVGASIRVGAAAVLS